MIGVRSFGSTPELVSRHGAAFVTGLQSAGVAACAKHFPGHGSTVVDSHLGLPTVDDPAEVVRRRDLAPFAAAVDAGVKALMTAHVVFSAYDDRPATLSRVLLGMLRDEFGFEGLVVSDALDMKAIAAGVGHGEGAVLTLLAGTDLICIGNPGFPATYDAEKRLDLVVDAIVGAAAEGRLPDRAARGGRDAGRGPRDMDGSRPGPDPGPRSTGASALTLHGGSFGIRETSASLVRWCSTSPVRSASRPAAEIVDCARRCTHGTPRR